MKLLAFRQMNTQSNITESKIFIDNNWSVVELDGFINNYYQRHSDGDDTTYYINVTKNSMAKDRVTATSLPDYLHNKLEQLKAIEGKA